MYTANNTDVINVFNLTTGAYLKNGTFTLGGNIGGLSANGAGTVLYAGQFTPGTIYGLHPIIPPASPWFTIMYGPVSTPTSHDAVVGLNGHVFATDIYTPNTGVLERHPTLQLTTALPPLQFVSGNSCGYFLNLNAKPHPVKEKHCYSNLSGMAFDEPWGPLGE